MSWIHSIVISIIVVWQGFLGHIETAKILPVDIPNNTAIFISPSPTPAISPDTQFQLRVDTSNPLLNSDVAIPSSTPSTSKGSTVILQVTVQAPKMEPQDSKTPTPPQEVASTPAPTPVVECTDSLILTPESTLNPDGFYSVVLTLDISSCDELTSNSDFLYTLNSVVRQRGIQSNTILPPDHKKAHFVFEEAGKVGTTFTFRFKDITKVYIVE